MYRVLTTYCCKKKRENINYPPVVPNFDNFVKSVVRGGPLLRGQNKYYINRAPGEKKKKNLN